LNKTTDGRNLLKRKIIKIMKKYIKLCLFLGIILNSCSNGEWEFDDYPTQVAYFPYQSPVRPLLLGKYDQGYNENDNNHRFSIGVTMSGVYENNEERKVHYMYDESLLDTVANVLPLPQDYYTIETPSPVTIPSGSTKGYIEIQLQEAFFEDTLSFSPRNTTNWVIPLLITDVENLDGTIRGESLFQNPVRVIADDWEVVPKDYTLFGIKFFNKYHADYLRRGVDTRNDGTNSYESVYREEFVVEDEVVSVVTSGYRKVRLDHLILRGDLGSPGSFTKELIFDEQDNCIVTGIGDNPYFITGNGKFVENGDEFGGKKRDVIYLDYAYADTANNETHTVKDTLVVRDRAIIFEEFIIEIK
jgi:hypothetical protein